MNMSTMNLTATPPNDHFISECGFINTSGQAYAFFTKRYGGCSKGSHASMNCSPYCGDDDDAVAKNRALLLKSIPHRIDALLIPRQVHGDRVVDLTQQDLCRDCGRAALLIDGADALVTSAKRACLAVCTADCVPLLLYSPAGVVSAVHSGWRGTLAMIAAKAVAKMSDSYGCDPSEIRAYLGPSISAAAYEVGDDVHDAFRKSGFNMAAIFKRGEGAGKWHLDLWEANCGILRSAGLREENICVSGICSYTNYKTYFSARRLGTASGRMLSGIMLL